MIPPGWGRSLGMLTELALQLPASRLEDRGDHLVIRTPGQPGYYWGNFLAFRDPPGPAAAVEWPQRFEAAFGAERDVRHMAFGWDDPTGAPGHAADFAPAGFVLETGSVLTADAVRPPARPTEGLMVRPLAGDADWAAATTNQLVSRVAGLNPGPYEVVKRARMATYRAMAEAGRGAWYGAFMGDRLVADLGIFMVGSVGRFQAVGTHPDYRGRGVCATLVHAAAAHAFTALGAGRLAIVAEPGEAGDRVYRSLGFVPTERFAGTLRMPAGDKA